MPHDPVRGLGVVLQLEPFHRYEVPFDAPGYSRPGTLPSTSGSSPYQYKQEDGSYCKARVHVQGRKRHLLTKGLGRYSTSHRWVEEIIVQTVI